MKHTRISKLLILCINLCALHFLHAEENNTPEQAANTTINEVYLLPTIHSRHERKGEFYDLKRLTKVVTEIKADIFCTEITPQSLKNIQAGKPDRRLKFFPEYTKVILKLEKELDYEVVPCSAWTPERNFKTIGIKEMDKAHYGLIAKALDKYSNQGKRIVISFGAGHMNGLLVHLRQRKDIKIIDYRTNLNSQKRAYLKSLKK